jgi:ribonuclease HI
VTSPLIEIFTDGACRGNPGPGGWAALMRQDTTEKMLSGAEPATTNNRMEVMAAIEALRAIQRPSRIRLTTDSEYLRQGVTSWVKRWKLNGWRTAAKQPVKNQDLWVLLDSLVGTHEIEWCWVKGHSGHAENERVDEAANVAIDDLLARRSVAGGK